MHCPNCKAINYKKNGTYSRSTDGVCVQRYKCRECKKGFSEQTGRWDYYKHHKGWSEFIFRFLCKGMSQRGLADASRFSRNKISSFVVALGKLCEQQLKDYRLARKKVEILHIDELETFELSKMLPVTVPIAVEAKSRIILSVNAGSIACKGRLAKKSVAKYGKRKCERARVLDESFKELQDCTLESAHFITDKSTHYSNRIKKNHPNCTHTQVKGRKGCITGQGELKEGGWDPLFSLNHTYAMFRDNIKRLSRRTWCTSKSIRHLKYFLAMYAWYHNCRLIYGSKCNFLL